MALSRPLFVGFGSASKVAREGGDLEVTVQTARGPVTFTLPWFFVRDVDALLERWRREEHEATLLNMNRGALGRTLGEAAAAGGLRDVTFLLARGVDVDYRYEGITPLWRSAGEGHLQVTTALLDAGAGRLDVALHWATYHGHPLVVALLLDRGADVHYSDDISLRGAAERGHLEIVRLLIDRGADLHAADNDALRAARTGGNEAVVALLLERGAVDV